MKKTLLYASLIGLALSAPVVNAIPVLQLDIVDGDYDACPDDTTCATTPAFTLVALWNPQGEGDSAPPIGDDYFISASVAPKLRNSADLGSFDFEGTTYAVTADMGSDDGNPGLPPHGIFNTFFKQFTFKFDQANTWIPYNAVTDPGAHGLPSPDPSGTGYFQTFVVDTSLLDPTVKIHFDLYHRAADGSVDKNAPFSHDAESMYGGDGSGQTDEPPLPEPGSMALMGIGLAALAGSRRRKSAA